MNKDSKTGRVKPTELIPGSIYNNWTIIEFSHKDSKSGNLFWTCKCSCGNIRQVAGHRIIRQESTQCSSPVHKKGNKYAAKHGMKHTKIYSVYTNMKWRCLNPNSHNYHLYGGRGIKVCDRWLESFENFYEDMKDGYAEGLQIDRIDVNGDYSKENCRWVTNLVNNGNKRNTVYITYQGVTKRAQDWAKELGLKGPTVVKRYRIGYSPSECLFGKNNKI